MSVMCHCKTYIIIVVGALILHDEMCTAACNYSLSCPPPLIPKKKEFDCYMT